jgi:hypothetical protein
MDHPPLTKRGYGMILKLTQLIIFVQVCCVNILFVLNINRLNVINFYA